jgi:hypothetical protein
MACSPRGFAAQVHAVKFYSNWLPLKNEDAHTALVFGFLRHAPVDLALNPWLKEILGRDVLAARLEPMAFWPRFPSMLGDQHVTEPDLAFPIDAGEGSPCWVIVEAKPQYMQHTADQLSREVIDTVRGTGALRVALIMVGAYLGPPAERQEWESSIRRQLHESGLPGVNAELFYSSWARLGAHVEHCGHTHSDWAAYAEDVLTHLQDKGLLGYKGPPMFEGLDGLSVPNVIEGYNRVILAARQFFLALHGESRFQALGLRPLGTKGFEMLRDDPSSVLTQYQDWFTTTTLISPYTRAGWSADRGTFAAFFFDQDGAYLVAGAFSAATRADLAATFAESDESQELTNEHLRDTAAPDLDTTSVGGQNQFRYAARNWGAGSPTEDVEWTLGCLEAAASIWDQAPASPG